MTGTKTYRVKSGLIVMSKNKQMMAVITPPIIWAKPVPTIFLTPSTSFMIRETSSPVLTLSKYLTGSCMMCF